MQAIGQGWQGLNPKVCALCRKTLQPEKSKVNKGLPD